MGCYDEIILLCSGYRLLAQGSVINLAMPIHQTFYLWLMLAITEVRRTDSRFVPSQWETALLCNDVSHWLGANLESALGKETISVHCLWREIRGSFQKGFTSLSLKSCESSLCCDSDSDHPIKLQFCICHDSWAVMTYAKQWLVLIYFFQRYSNVSFYKSWIMSSLWNGSPKHCSIRTIKYIVQRINSHWIGKWAEKENINFPIFFNLHLL